MELHSATNMLLSILLILCLENSEVECGNVLLFFPFARSQLLSGTNMANILADDGHNVTMVICINDEPDIIKSSKYDIIYFKTSLSRSEEQSILKGATKFSPIDLLRGFPPTMRRLVGERCRTFLFDEGLHAKIAELKPDLAIVNIAHGCVTAHLLHIRVPFINFVPVPLIPAFTGYSHRVPAPPSFVPDGLMTGDVHTSFSRRVINYLLHLFLPYIFPLFVFNEAQALVHEYQVKHGLPHEGYFDIRAKASFLMVHGDITFESIRPTLPKIVYVGGIQCVAPQPLTNDLETFVSASGEHGLIVFSIGGILDSVPDNFLEMFLDVFRELPQHVVWRLKNVPPHLRNKIPRNVRIVEWLPQQDLLGHLSTKLFITHGGIQGTFESVCHGKPALGIEFNGDQVANIMILVNKGMALYAGTSKTLHAADIKEKILKLLNDPTYMENAVKARTLFYDQPQTAAERFSFTVNYTIRHKGAYHLTSKAAMELHWFQYYSFDVVIFLFVVSFLLLAMICFLLKCCFRCCVFVFLAKKAKKE